jgi:hypothetical protein
MLPVDSMADHRLGRVDRLWRRGGRLLGLFARLTHGAIARTMAVGAGLLLAAATP